MHRRPMRQQILLATILPIALLGVVTTIVAWSAIHRITLDLVLSRSAGSTQVVASAVAGDILSYKHLLQSAAASLGDDETVQADFQIRLENMSGFLTPFQGGVTLLDASGVAVANTPGQENRSGIDYSFREYFRQVEATGRPVFSPVFKEIPSGRDVVVVAVPVPSSRPGRPVLVGAFFLAQQPWVDTLALLPSPREGGTFIIDDRRTIISHADADQVGKVLAQDSPLVEMMAAGNAISLVFTSKETGQRMVAAYAPVPGTTWGVVSTELLADLQRPAIPYLVAVTVAVTASIGLAVIVLLGNIERISRPLARLATVTDQVSLGEPFRPMRLEGPQEVRSLIGAANRMISRLAEQQARSRQYAIQVLRSQEEERKRISRDLHDETVQELVGLVQRLELCRRDISDKPQSAVMRLEELDRIAQNTLAEVRRMSNDLRPFILEDLGLPAALQALSEQLAAQLPNASVHCEIVGHERHLSPELELTAFRIAQEALNNVRKHASSTPRANVTLFFEDWGILVTVEDAGPGFHVPSTQSLVRSKHLGLAGMVERAQLFGGSLTISSVPGEGTQVSLRLNADALSDVIRA